LSRGSSPSLKEALFISSALTLPKNSPRRRDGDGKSEKRGEDDDDLPSGSAQARPFIRYLTPRIAFSFILLIIFSSLSLEQL
jgi:hypothetical protein